MFRVNFHPGTTIRRVISEIQAVSWDHFDTESDPDAEALWLAEAERRAGELDRGEVTPVSAETLEQRVRARLR